MYERNVSQDLASHSLLSVCGTELLPFVQFSAQMHRAESWPQVTGKLYMQSSITVTEDDVERKPVS